MVRKFYLEHSSDMHCSRVLMGKGDILVADIEELVNFGSSEINPGRLNAKKIITPKSSEHFIFPLADGTAKLSGRDQGIRKSTPTRDRLVRIEDVRTDFQGSSETSQPMDEKKKETRKARNDVWSIEGVFICRHHAEPRVQLYVPKEENIPNTTEIH